MTSLSKVAAALCLVAFAAACQQQQQPDPVFVAPAPIVAEPTFDKYDD